MEEEISNNRKEKTWNMYKVYHKLAVYTPLTGLLVTAAVITLPIVDVTVFASFSLVNFIMVVIIANLMFGITLTAFLLIIVGTLLLFRANPDIAVIKKGLKWALFYVIAWPVLSALILLFSGGVRA